MPYLLGGLEGFTQIAHGTPARHTPAQLRGAARMGWKVRLAGGRLDIGRPGKALRHTIVTGTPTWYGPTPAVLYVLISEKPSGMCCRGSCRGQDLHVGRAVTTGWC
ncbi:hypothetical protein OG618_36665 [Kitasatospora sp. NBC_01246]|uniref:hypothetical protein n=1 Tax=Kitasatospora sp. NBC_01246 TaxID=2903570 RepID=UPI002E32F567|nr:hypothetical protein [Kitasatospora sp. NBC_01246]